MTISFVQQVVAPAAPAGSVASAVLPVTAKTTVGNTVILAFRSASGVVPKSVTDSKGNQYTIYNSGGSGATAALVIGYQATALDPAAGDTITVTPSAAAAVRCCADEYKGIAAAAPVTAHVAALATGTLSVTASITPVNATDQLFAAYGASGGAPAASDQAGTFTLRDMGASTGFAALYDFLANAATNARSPAFQITAGTTNQAVVVVALADDGSTPPAPDTTARIARRWDGSAWTAYPLRAWDGSAWSAASAASSGDVPVPGELLWEPDYTVAQADGSTIGGIWYRVQPPFVRGRKAVERLAIVTAADVPGDTADPYRPAGALRVTINPPSTDADFMVTATADAASDATSIFVSPADAALLEFQDAGDFLTNQTTSEHMRLTAPANTTTGELTISRGLESTASAITTGDLLKVATGDVNPQAGFSSRTEVYDRFPAGGGSTPPLNWPDPVGSERWYGISYFLPADMDLTSDAYGGSNWLDITQWKGQFGGSPPRALGLDPAGDGTAKWVIDHDGGVLHTLGAVKLGQWNRFVFGYKWGTTAATGWSVIYLNGEQVFAQTAEATLDANGSTSTTATVVQASAEITVADATNIQLGDTVTNATGPIPKGALVIAKTGTTITLDQTATADSAGVTVSLQHADPIYFKNGIYRTTAWKVAHTIHIGPPKIGTTIDDVRDEDPPPPADVTIAAAPSGPAAPADGWKVVAADGFNPAYPLSSLWYPNRYEGTGDLPGFNANEVEVFNPSQVAVTENGCELTAVCIDAAKSTASYRSGAITTASINGGGASPGLLFKPTPGQVIALEAIIRLPTIGGADMGYWSSNGSYEEIDYFEQQNWAGSQQGAQYPAMNVISWFGTNAGVAFSSELNLFQWDNTAPFTSPANDGKRHRWTVVFDGNAKTMSCYLDGQPFIAENPNSNYARVSSVGLPWPTTALMEWQFVLLSFALRDAGNAGAVPPYVLGEGDSCVIESFAAYVNGDADTSASIQGGLIAPGTTVG